MSATTTDSAQVVSDLLAPEEYGEDSQDVGDIVHMEHINLEVPDLEVARLFFGEGLGLTADPGTTGPRRGGLHVVWYNCGRQQFHIVKGPVAQRLPPGGSIGLVLPDVQKVAKQLEKVQQLLGDISISHQAPDRLEVVDPNGLTFIIHSSLPDFPTSRGIAYLLLPCFQGTAASIAHFYSTKMGALTRCSGGGSESSSSSDGSSSNGGLSVLSQRAEVAMGPGSKLVFVEQPSLGQLSDQAVKKLFSGWHVAMYINRFSTHYKLIGKDGLVFNKHPYSDKCHSLQDALRNRQFRFQDIPLLPTHDSDTPATASSSPTAYEDGSPGRQLAFRLSHEVRSMHHPLYMRPLYNRGAPNFDVES